MPQSNSCPSVIEYKQLLSGISSPAVVAELAGHIESCAHCAATIQNLLNEDTLGDDVRAAGSKPALAHLPPALVSKLLSLSDSPQPVSQMDTGGVTTDGSWNVPRLIGDATVCVTPAMMAPQGPGEIGWLAGYRVLELLGQGGMGIVYLAEDVQLQRQVALKVMKPDLARNETARRRFLAEARAAAKINSDHVVTIYQTGEDAGTAFVAMELLRGQALDEWLKARRDLKLSELIQVAREVALGLAAAHEHGLIHRDIKPGNIWMEASGRIKILDFGLARTIEGDAHLTGSGAVVGTPAYMAPEQARGGKVDHRADLFSLGCVLHRMTTGQLPFKGDTVMSVLTALAIETPPPAHELNPSVPMRLSRLITSLLAKDPAQRPQTALQVAEELNAILSEQIVAKQPSLAQVASAAPVMVPIVLTPPEQPSEFDFGGKTEAIASPLATERPRSRNLERDLDDAEDTDSPPTRRSHKPLILAGVAAVLLVLVGIAAAQFIFSTKDGTLIVEVDDAADVRFKQGKLELYDEKGELKYTIEPSEKNKTLPPGKYLVKVVGTDGIKLETDSFELDRKGKAYVRVKAAGPVQVAGTNPKPKDPVVPNPPPVGNTVLWKAMPEQQAWLDNAAKLGVAERRILLDTKNRELNAEGVYHSGNYYKPVFAPAEGTVTTVMMNQGGHEGGTFIVWPLAAFPTITHVDLRGTGVIDFSPLTTLPLTELGIDLTLDNASGEKAIRALATLKTINGKPAAEFWKARDQFRLDIAKLEALAQTGSLEARKREFDKIMSALNPGYRPETVRLTFDQRTSRTALSGDCPVFDLSPVRALKVTEFSWSNGPLDLSPLANTQITHLTLWGGVLRDLSPLANLPLKELTIVNAQRLQDLRPLSGLKLERLVLTGSPPNGGFRRLSLLTDISPLKGMPLKSLTFQFMPIVELEALEGMPLKEFRITGAMVMDLSPLKGMKLELFECGSAPAGNMGWWGQVASDLAPLEGMPIREFTGEVRPYYEPNEKLLKSLPLQKLNGKEPAVFWKEVEADKKTKQAFVDEVLKEGPEKAVEKVRVEVKKVFSELKDFKIEDGAVTEARLTMGMPYVRPFEAIRAFQKLRILTLESHDGAHSIDFSALLDLPLEELTCNKVLITYNAPVLRLMTKLKTINGKPAKEVLGPGK